MVHVKRVVLLGAGASKEAGIPLTGEMTRRILEQVGANAILPYRGVAQALNYVVGAIIGHRSAQGVDPYHDIDVERVFSAVEALAERSTHELAPFVNWASEVERLDRRVATMPAFFDDNLRRAIARNRGAENLIKQAIEATTGIGSGAVYRQVLDAMMGSLRQLVKVSAPVDYLSPLGTLAAEQPGGLGVATLNYDLSVEAMAETKGVVLSTGVGAWSETEQLSWPSDGLRLIKLHGSIDWSLGDEHAGQGRLGKEVFSVTSDGAAGGSPGIIFGERGKLRASGPFLDLLSQFALELREADELVVVGYSFRDEHVNVMLRRWSNADVRRTITVIDPYFPARGSFRSKDFRSELWSLVPFEGAGPSQTFTPRMRVILSHASEGLPVALGTAS